MKIKTRKLKMHPDDYKTLLEKSYIAFDLPEGEQACFLKCKNDFYMLEFGKVARVKIRQSLKWSTALEYSIIVGRKEISH